MPSHKISIKEMEAPPGIDDTLLLDRADRAIQLGFVMCRRICKKIRESNCIIADVTEPNRNMFYELGLSYGLRKDIILINRNTFDDAAMS